MSSPNHPQKRLPEESSPSENVTSTHHSAKKQKTDVPLDVDTQEQLPSQPSPNDVENPSQCVQGLQWSDADRDQVWSRPPVQDFAPDHDVLCFQSIEAEQGTLASGATVQLFGVNARGNSVMLHVTDFKHYMYIDAPPAFQNSDCKPFQSFLCGKLSYDHGAVHSVSLVLRGQMYGFRGDEQSPVLKIAFTDPGHIWKLKRLIEAGDVDYKGMWRTNVNNRDNVMSFVNLGYVSRFMVDCKVRGMSWVEVPAGAYTIVSKDQRQSSCQIEARVSYRELIAHEPEGEWATMAPLRTVSLNILCTGREKIPLEPGQDAVIQIANIATQYGESTSFVRNVFSLGSTGAIDGTDVLEFQEEKVMLHEWQKFLVKLDPDVITGYNMSGFDLPYLLDRAKHLQIPKFSYLSRSTHIMYRHKPARDDFYPGRYSNSYQSAASNMPGRLHLDVRQLIQREHSLWSYSFNAVCAHFLHEQKESIHQAAVTSLHHDTTESRGRLAGYCIRGASLSQRLVEKLYWFENYTEQARVAGVPFNSLVLPSKPSRFTNLIHRKAHDAGFLVLDVPFSDPDDGVGYDDEGLGATSILGYYDVPISILKFASLRPSIMQVHNLCYSTQVEKTEIETLGLKLDEDYIQTSTRDTFVTVKQKMGFLGQIIEELLEAQSRADCESTTELDPIKKTLLRSRQMALKSSIGGVCGLASSVLWPFPCAAIRGTTASIVRQTVNAAKEAVEAEFTIAKGYSHDAHVISTAGDSLVVKFGTKDLEEAMKLARAAAMYVSFGLAAPMKLELHGHYFPYLCLGRNRYAGLRYLDPLVPDEVVVKGLGDRRQDSCDLVKTAVQGVLQRILKDGDIPGAQEYVKGTIADLLQNKIDMSQLIMTKPLTGKGMDSNQPHALLAATMKRRDPVSAPGQGDRIAYVKVRSGPGTKKLEFEDPQVAVEHNIEVDTKFYIGVLLAKALRPIFEPIVGEQAANALFVGAHTRTVVRTAPTGGMAAFLTKVEACMACKKPLPAKGGANTAVCEDCTPQAQELYNKTLGRVTDRETRSAGLLAQCQICQGGPQYDFICVSGDCPVRYKRTKATKDVEAAQKELARFGLAEALSW